MALDQQQDYIERGEFKCEGWQLCRVVRQAEKQLSGRKRTCCAYNSRLSL